MKTTVRTQYLKAIELFRKEKTINEVATILTLSVYRVKKWYAIYRKMEKVNLENKFIVDFGCGRISVNGLSKKYKINSRILLKLKHKHYGKGSLKQKRMYQMHIAEIPTRAIADFFNTHIVQVQRSIRLEKARKKVENQ